jgi:septum site-determining protein MinC
LVRVAQQRWSLTYRPRSYTAFVFAPQPPVVDWLIDLDATLERSSGFFTGHPVVLDLSAVHLSPSGIMNLISSLEERKIRVLGIEGVNPAEAQAGLPPILRRGLRGEQTGELPEPSTSLAGSASQKEDRTSLLIDDPVRSGQCVVFPGGDVTVLGSVGSGAEIVAGGSIHIYGALRGRAMAGANGNTRARIFCQRVEAELLAIDSYFKTADEIEENLRHGPAQVWLEGGTLRISAIN